MQIMQTILQVFNSNAATVHEDAMQVRCGTQCCRPLVYQSHSWGRATVADHASHSACCVPSKVQLGAAGAFKISWRTVSNSCKYMLFLQAVSPFLYALGKQFDKYLPTFIPYLRTGLTNYKEVQVSHLHHPHTRLHAGQPHHACMVSTASMLGNLACRTAATC